MRWVPLVCLVLFIVPFSGCTGKDFAPIASADWKPGYTFGYSFSLAADMTSTLTMDGKVVEDESESDGGEDVALFSYRVVSTQMKDGTEPLYLVVTNGDDFSGRASTSGNAYMYASANTGNGALLGIRQKDLQPVRTTVSMPSCPSCPAPSIRFAKDSDDYSWIRFPLTNGDSWTGSVPNIADMPGMMSDKFQVESQVTGMTTVDGPTGKVDAVRITHSMTDPALEGIEQQIKAAAAEEGVTLNAFDIGFDIDAVVFYAPSLHNVVQQVLTVSLTLHADFEQEGKHFVGDMEGTAVISQRLLSADLTPGPELSLEDAVASLDDLPELPVVPPPGTDPDQAHGGSLRLAADKELVNAADNPTVQFTTTASGTAVTDSYEIVDADGASVASGQGGDFSFVVAEPGTFTAIVTGTDDTGRTLVAKKTILADFEATAPAECAIVSAIGILTCEAASVPVRPGIEFVQVTAKRTPLAGEMGLGTLYLTDPDGRSEYASMSGNEATITVVELDGSSPGDWTVQYKPVIGVAEDIEYTIQVLHVEGPVKVDAGDYWSQVRSLADPAAGPMRLVAFG